MHSLDPTFNIPLIYADYNQTGKGDSLFASAQVQIINPLNGQVVGSWQLDRQTNNTWDQNAPTYNFGAITFTDAANCASIGLWDPLTGVGCAGVTTDGATFTGSHNIGSGHADFMVFADTMNLSLYDPSYLFVATINLGCNPDGVASGLAGTTQGCNTNGFEEFGLIGGVAAVTVPEPGSLALLGLGLAGLGFARRRKLN